MYQFTQQCLSMTWITISIITIYYRRYGVIVMKHDDFFYRNLKNECEKSGRCDQLLT